MMSCNTCGFSPPRIASFWLRAFGKADLILSVSHFNTRQLVEAFPRLRGPGCSCSQRRGGPVLRAGQPAGARQVRADLAVPPRVPYLLSVANFQPRKNLARLIRAVAAMPEVARRRAGPGAAGNRREDEARPLREAIAAVGRKAIIRMPGYRQGKILRTAYAEATTWSFPRSARASASRWSRP